MDNAWIRCGRTEIVKILPYLRQKEISGRGASLPVDRLLIICSLLAWCSHSRYSIKVSFPELSLLGRGF